MKKKLLLTVLLLLAIVICITWFYKLVFLSLILCLWRRELAKRMPWRYGMKVLAMVMILAIFWAMPRYRTNSSDRIQLLYQTKEGEVTTPPLYQYIANTLFPEEEVLIVGLFFAGNTPQWVKFPVGKSLVRQFLEEYATNGNSNFVAPMKHLRNSGCNPMSGFCSQFFNSFMPKTKSVYVIRPKNYEAEKAYPVVFFCHGYLGNWRFHQSIMMDLEDCFVISVGTPDLSGLYTNNDIEGLFQVQLPFLESLGYKIDYTRLHLVGLSNGDTASEIAYRYYANKLRSITYISCSPDQTYYIPSKVNLIGGGGDESANNHPALLRSLKANGVDAAMYWHKEDSHFTMVANRKEILAFLNERINDIKSNEQGSITDRQ